MNEEFKINVGKALKQLRLQQGLNQSQFAQRVGIKRASTLSDYELGKTETPLSVLMSACSVFNAPLNSLIPATPIVKKPRFFGGEGYKPTKRIPILTKIPAGSPQAWFASDWLEELPDIQDIIPRSPYVFGLRVDGDSMFPYIYPGDIVVVDPDQPADQGDLAVARIGDESTLKYVRFEGNIVHLVPENLNYTPIEIPRSEVEFLGKVVALARDSSNGRRGFYSIEVVEVLKNEQVYKLALMLAEMPEEFLEALRMAIQRAPQRPDARNVYRVSHWMQRILRWAQEEIEKVLRI